jgi:MOSC domain-containing protein YiiM
MPTVVAVSVGAPRQVPWRGRLVETAIFKAPVEGPVRVLAGGLAGDRQADLQVHGGPRKAVYAYPSEHYAFWREELDGVPIPFGAFGENLTLAGLFEADVLVGDRLRVGTAELVVTEPRLPCYKLGLRLGDPDVVRRFLLSERLGLYLGVARPGLVEAGSPVEVLERRHGSVSVAEVARLMASGRSDVAALTRAAACDALAGSWREGFRERLRTLAAGGR